MAEVRVRMYRYGLGDCFLLTFPGVKREVHVLIDCGVLKGTPDATEEMQRRVAHIRKTTGGIDVLVVTHEHWDHVSGFLQAANEFATLPIRRVWLAWTEDLSNDLGTVLRKRKEKAQEALDEARQKLALSAAPAASESLKALDALHQFTGDFGAAGRKTTASAMKWAREATGGEVEYLTPGSEPLTIPGVEGVRVYVLGPPEDAKLLRRSDPSRRTPEVYELASGMDLGFAAALHGPGEPDEARPFDQSFEIPVEQAAQDRFFKATYHAEGWRQIEDDWLGSAEHLALQMNSDTNNTSLVLAFELVASERVLLFPGDAQIGNWLSWEHLKWKVKDKHGDPVEVTARNLLERTVLYKVGHHASHNATLREKGLEVMNSSELVAMIPVAEEQARGLDWDMPFPPLLSRLSEKAKGRIIRADTGVAAERPEYVSERVWAAFRERSKDDDPEKRFVDYVVPMEPSREVDT